MQVGKIFWVIRAKPRDKAHAGFCEVVDFRVYRTPLVKCRNSACDFLMDSDRHQGVYLSFQCSLGGAKMREQFPIRYVANAAHHTQGNPVAPLFGLIC